MSRFINLDYHQQRMELIENGNLQDFIQFAKSYNIFQEAGTSLYKEVCNKIKARLDREGLAYDTVRPD